MNKVKRRAMSALLVAALVFCGIGVYIYRYINHGAEWATFAAHSSVDTSGVLTTGTPRAMASRAHMGVPSQREVMIISFARRSRP